MRGSPLEERDAPRHLVQRQRRAVELLDLELPRPFLGVHPAGLREGLSEDGFRRLVVEDEVTVGVGDERRCGELRRELSREDEHQVLLASAFHRR